MNKPELLSPAGTYEGFLGAVSAGADAVYFGGSAYSARAYADNFTADEGAKAIRYARLFNVKTYLTINTLADEKELDGLDDFLSPYAEAGLTGVIVQDLGILRLIREHFPELKIHASTQMAVTGIYGAMLLKRHGCSRIVPARELSLYELKNLREKADVEVEAFIHGAMCYSYSGLCLFSGMIGGRSANRGRCAAPCRLAYTCESTAATSDADVTENANEASKTKKVSHSGTKKGSRLGLKNSSCLEAKKSSHPETKKSETYILSMKDLNSLNDIGALIEAGIDSFKIEGRMKRPEYTAGVTAVYRKYIDRYFECLNARSDFEIDEKDARLLSNLYQRTDVESGYIHRHNGAELITVKRPGYNGTDYILLKNLRERYIENPKKLPADIVCTVRAGENVRVKVSCCGKSFEAIGAIAEKAKNKPLAKEDILKQMKKTGDTFFTPGNIIAVTGDANSGAFVPVSTLNELRRKALCGLEEKLLNG